MKPITREDCELMWVWDRDRDRDNPKDKKRLVVAIFPDGSCVVICNNDKFTANNTTLYDHCEEIEKEKVKKWVPCECREDLPEGWLDGWMHHKRTGAKSKANSQWLDENMKLSGLSWQEMFDWYEWSPTFDGPWQPIGKMVEVDGE